MDAETLDGVNVSEWDKVIVVALGVNVDGFVRQNGGWRFPAILSVAGDLLDLALPLRTTEDY